MTANGLAFLSNNINYLVESQGKPDLALMEHVKQGRPTKITLDECRKDKDEFVNYFLKGVLGEIKLKIVTGKILDYKA
jgi:hypothetical protein